MAELATAWQMMKPPVGEGRETASRSQMRQHVPQDRHLQLPRKSRPRQPADDHVKGPFTFTILAQIELLGRCGDEAQSWKSRAQGLHKVFVQLDAQIVRPA